MPNQRTVIRYLPTYRGHHHRSCRSPDGHIGLDGKKLRVSVNVETKAVIKINPSNWTDTANRKFKVLYHTAWPLLPSPADGYDVGISEMERMRQLSLDRLEAWSMACKKINCFLPELKLKLLDQTVEKLEKRLAEAKAEAAKKAKAEALKAQLALLEQQEEDDGYNSSDFPDSDDEGQVWNPYEHNGVQYHLDDDRLYTKEGEYYGFIDKDGNVDLRPRLADMSSDDFSDEDDEDQESNPEELWSPLTEPIAKETKSLGETKTHEPVTAPSDSKRCKSYTKEEDRKIEDYMTNPENEGRKKAQLYRELEKILPGRKFQNIGTRWERYVRPEMFKRQRDEVEAENADLKSQLETLKSNLLNIAQSIKI